MYIRKPLKKQDKTNLCGVVESRTNELSYFDLPYDIFDHFKPAWLKRQSASVDAKKTVLYRLGSAIFATQFRI